ncbi:M14 family zinc carboxypeptidase [Microbacterium sp. APC 3898]|uniref:M14 family zinc carboxypeptidase n=2 Tax=Planococcus TaxID=1372 RepID=A0ABT7ZMU6_9BACL|nr:MULTISPECIES: M14 family zinc carboxypeptidase [Terrabacteria group]MDN3428493.1 M14 family zinc carboxypeptidase [Planococcus sp. APC 4016]MDN3498800.1 M14 family zinc carboxypeptidase [Microbacterium sp. APC 3898]
MKRRWASTVGVLGLCTALAMPVYAVENEAKPAQHHHDNSISGFIDYQELQKSLKQIESNSKGTVQVNVAGQSHEGLDIYTARVGTGDKVLLMQSEIHGNEKTGTVAILNLLKTLSNNSKQSKAIREEVTIVFMPMMNPDASEADKRRNSMTWNETLENFPQLAGASPSWNYLDRGISQSYDYGANPGFDVNRDFNPDLDYVPQAQDFPGASNQPGWFITPEAQTSRDVYKSLQDEFGNVDVFVDLHHQGLYYVDGTADPVTLSLSAQFVPDPSTPEGAKYAEYADSYDYDFSRQLNLLAYNELQSYGQSKFTNISLYSQGLDLPGTALGTYALNGSGTVLFEVRGQTQSLGQKEKGQLVKSVERGLSGIIEGVADGSVDQLDPEAYEDIPLTAYQPAF